MDSPRLTALLARLERAGDDDSRTAQVAAQLRDEQPERGRPSIDDFERQYSVEDVDGTTQDFSAEDLEKARLIVHLDDEIDSDIDYIGSETEGYDYDLAAVDELLTKIQAARRSREYFLVGESSVGWGDGFVVKAAELRAAQRLVGRYPLAVGVPERYIRFTLGPWTAYLESSGLLHIGCQHYTLAEWAARYDEIADDNTQDYEKSGYVEAARKLFPILRELLVELQKPLPRKRKARKTAKGARRRTGKIARKRARRA